MQPIYLCCHLLIATYLRNQLDKVDPKVLMLVIPPHVNAYGGVVIWLLAFLTSVVIDMYMSYRWRESFNTVRFVTSSQRGLTCGRRMRKGGGGGMDHTSVAALTNQLCSDRGVVRVFEYSINP